MLYAAGVGLGRLVWDAENLGKELRYIAVALVDGPRAFEARLGEAELAVVLHLYVSVVLQYADGAAHAGFAERKGARDVDGADRTVFSFKYQYGFKIHLAGFLH